MTVVRDHGHVTLRRLLPVLLLGAVAAVTGLLPVASAAGCTATVTVTRPALAVRLEPSQVTVTRGSCVTFVNDAGTQVEVTVDPDYDETVAAGDRVVYAARSTGTHPMRATDGITRDDGSITVRAAPSPSSSPSAPPHTSSPTPPPTTAPPPSPGGSGPRVAPSPSHHPSRSARPVPRPSRTVPQPAPVPTPGEVTPPPPTAAGPIEPPSDRSAGLPGAVAALAIVGVGGALGRVLLAQPVDSRASVGGAP
jgi:plastocyanin